MIRLRQLPAALALMALPLMALLPAGCNRGATTAAPDAKASPGNSRVLVNSGEAEMESATSETGSVALPTDFPQDVPVYPNARVATTSVSPQSKLMILALETPDAPAKIVDYYQKELEAHGWSVVSSLKSAKGGSISAQKGDRFCSATIGLRGKTAGSIVSLSVVEHSPRR